MNGGICPCSYTLGNLFYGSNSKIGWVKILIVA